MRGLDAAFITPYLERGMLRPGMVEFLAMLRDIGATTIVYTHSEYVWAKKVCDAMVSVAGFAFIKHLFGRCCLFCICCRGGLKAAGRRASCSTAAGHQNSKTVRVTAITVCFAPGRIARMATPTSPLARVYNLSAR